MKIVSYYVTIDGKVFDTEAKAQEHESQLRTYLMYDNRGNMTHNPDMAFYVYFSRPHEISAFIAECQEKRIPYEGLEEDGTCGLYKWDNTMQDRYVYVGSSNEVNTLYNVLDKIIQRRVD